MPSFRWLELGKGSSCCEPGGAGSSLPIPKRGSKEGALGSLTAPIMEEMPLGRLCTRSLPHLVHRKEDSVSCQGP